MNVEQSLDDLNRHLDEQIEFLRRSAEAYDLGHTGEAKRMAVTIRVLVHDTRNSRSLLHLLGKKEVVSFFDSALPDEAGNTLAYGGLVVIVSNPKGSRYAPSLDGGPKPEGQTLPFEDWWNAEVFRTRDGISISRKKLILTVSNQDGGAHVDPLLDETYAKLARENGMGWEFGTENEKYPITGAELAAVRQISHEVFKSLDSDYRKEFQLASNSIVMAGMSFREATPDEVHRRKKENIRKKKSHSPYRRKNTKTGRNEPCPCGSGSKYKRCHGRLA